VLDLVPLIGFLVVLAASLVAAEHALHRPAADRRRGDWLKVAVFLAILVLLLTAGLVGRGLVVPLVAAVAVAGFLELRRTGFGRRHQGATMLASLAIAAALAHLVMPSRLPWAVSFSLTVLFVATGDAFAQLWGKLIGRHKLCPRLSPGKTVEGLLGGLATVLAVACVAQGLTGLGRLPLLALVTAVAGVAGDLGFSAIKRASGIKDFSRALPGQGGVLDRFDSLIVAAPAFYWAQAVLISGAA